MSNATFGIAITADDKTAKGFTSAERRAAGANQRIGASSERSFGQIDRAATRSGRGIISTFSKIERASAGIFTGGGSGGGMIVSRLSAVSSAGEAAAGGLGEAAVAGGMLEATLGAVAVGGALVVGVIAGVAAITDKLASGWSKGVVGASNYASAIGVATKSLQEFQAAGERAGIDKNTSAAALGGLSETLNDARYGRNANAAGTLAFLGVKMKLNSDGTVDTVAMLPAIQAALMKQTSYGARQVAGNLGIGQAGLAIFRNGGPVAAKMEDAGRNANVVQSGDEEAARHYLDQRTRLGQMAERAGGRLGAGAAGAAQGVLDAATTTVESGGQNIVLGAERFSNSVTHEFGPAVHELVTAVRGWVGGGRFGEAKVDRLARAALPLYRRFLAHGDKPADAAAWAAAAVTESSGDPHKQQPGGEGYGLFQWGRVRQAAFKQKFGHDMRSATWDEEVAWRDYELRHDEKRGAGMIAAATSPGAKADAITRGFERPGAMNRDAADRSNVAGAIAQALDIRHHVTVTVEDRRTHATVHSKREDGTPIHYAFGKPPS